MAENEILLKILDKLESVDNRLNSLEVGQASLESGQASLKKDLSEVKDRTKKIELTLENDISKKLGVLFDGHALNAEKLDHISKTVDDIESSVVALDVMNKLNTDEIIKLKFVK